MFSIFKICWRCNRLNYAMGEFFKNPFILLSFEDLYCFETIVGI